MKIIKRNISELSQDPANARKHNERNLESIVASLRRFGQQTPIVIDSSSVVRKGNGTLEAAKRLGWDTINCVVTDLKSSDAISYAIADNRTAELAEWDDEVLAAQLNGLLADDPELMEVAGFTEEELAALLADSEIEPEVIEDEVPEPPVDPITKPGDLWILGNHRLLCGDSTKAEDVERLMAGAKADLFFTDPPYNIASENKGVAADVSKAHRNLMDSDWDKGFDFKSVTDRLLDCMAESATVYVCTSHHLASSIWDWMKQWSSHNSWCVWSKPNPMPSLMKRHWTWNAELICYATRGRHTFNFPAEGHALSVWEINKVNGKSGHPTEKPVAVPAHAISHSSSPGHLVVDLFLGSGTTLIAAEQLGRKCYGMEISSQYVDVICNRWAKLTNESPVLEETGETFDQVAKRRRGNE
jgi:DNA modification methylase